LSGCSCGEDSDSADGADADADTDTDTDVDADSDADSDSDTEPPPPPDEVCEAPVQAVDTTAPDTVVGDGTAESCTEDAFKGAIATGGVITFACGADPATITLTSEAVIGADTVIDGGGLVTLSGGGTTRILNMDTGNFEATGPLLTVQHLTFTGGHATGTKFRLGTDVDGGGGAIFYRGGSVTAIDCTFTDNKAAELGPDVAGGGIYGIGVGETIVVASRFNANRAANGGALGALHTALTVVNTTIVDNVATGNGANYIDEGGEQQGQGGNGGAIVMDGVGRTLRICGSTISNNEGGAFGGAVFRTSYESEPTIVDRSVFDSNRVRDTGEESSGAGGLYLQGTHVTMTATTVSNNEARGFAGLWIMGHGAAPGVADLTNVTIANNRTIPREDFTTRGIGGGLVIGDNATGTVLNCTIVGNEAQFASGIARVSPLVVRNTIISNLADNEWTPLNCTGSAYATPPGTGDGNVQWPNGRQDDMDCTEGILRADPLMGTLGDAGGPTPTVSPEAGSPAIGLGTDCPETDQRGEPRSEPCTAGAVEVP